MAATARASLWLRSVFRPTAERPQWGLVGFAAAGLLAGLAMGLAVDAWEVALLPGLTAGLVAACGASRPPAVASRVAGFAAASTVLFVCLGFLASGRPWLSAVLMAGAAVFTSAAFGTGPVGTALGVLGTLAFVMAQVISTVTSARESTTLLEVTMRVSAAGAVGWAVAVSGAKWRWHVDSDAAAPSPIAPPWVPIWHSVRVLDGHAREGIRRAVPLSICAAWFQWSGSRDALWVFVSAMAVLLPTGKSTLEAAMVRVLATVLGVVVVGVAARWLFVPVQVGVAVVALLIGLAYKAVVPLLAGAASAFAVVVLVGAPSGAVGVVASHRIFDTVIGASLALASTCLPWPRDEPEVNDTVRAAT